MRRMKELAWFVVWRTIVRCSTRLLPTLQYLQRLDGYGVAWRSFTEQYLDSTGIFKDAVISIMATIAKQENVRRSERIRPR